VLEAAERTAVSCAAGRRLERGGPGGEAVARQGACDRPLMGQECRSPGLCGAEAIPRWDRP